MVHASGLLGRLAVAALRDRPWWRGTVLPWLAKVLVAGGARPVADVTFSVPAPGSAAGLPRPQLQGSAVARLLESLEPSTRLAIRDHPTVVSLSLAFALNIARADMRQFLDAAARPLTRDLDLTRALDRVSTLARASTLDRALALARARLVRARDKPDPWSWPNPRLRFDDFSEYEIRSRIAAQGSALVDVLAVARDLAGDLDRDLARALALARGLDRAIALTRAHARDLDLDRAIARDLGLARARAREFDLDLDRARCNFVGFDLRRVDLTGRTLDGVRWSSATQWPAGWANQIQRDSVEIEPGLFEIRPSAADASGYANPLAGDAWFRPA